ncbi:MAG: glycosyltransferase family 39 protein, partial [Alphaproteobacteria bacterium]|nr:glycosyltransferase family 39 protein [Alphaproteobacteria bacterium]
EVWARLVSPLWGLAALFLTARLARQLWPDARTDVRRARAAIAPLMLVGGLYWAVFSTMTMFDMLVTTSAVLAILGYVKAWRGFHAGQGFWIGVFVAGLGLGLGGLAKGPAILVHTLPVALAAPLWGPALTGGRGAGAWNVWYKGVGASLLIGGAITLAWAVPAAIMGGEESRNAIFIKKSADRMVKS